MPAPTVPDDAPETGVGSLVGLLDMVGNLFSQRPIRSIQSRAKIGYQDRCHRRVGAHVALVDAAIFVFAGHSQPTSPAVALSRQHSCAPLLAVDEVPEEEICWWPAEQSALGQRAARNCDRVAQRTGGALSSRVLCDDSARQPCHRQINSQLWPGGSTATNSPSARLYQRHLTQG
ncbi:hypothetical protein ACQP0C_22390 [Nocardia sp. CA-129566]|uniref:hypothetical protein n=1 Tax=Nocardia sp. CA-129566 TaxID=3239976 RepID=UPI003D987E53